MLAPSPHTLASLAPGESGVITEFSVRGGIAQRIMQMGLLRGTRVKVLRRAITGDPIEIDVMGYALSLRLAEADLIRIDKEMPHA